MSDIPSEAKNLQLIFRRFFFVISVQHQNFLSMKIFYKLKEVSLRSARKIFEKRYYNKT
jgi:hypothetical protein